MWNVYNCFEDNLDRTNNVIESHHHVMKIISRRRHLGINELTNLLILNSMKVEHAMKEHLRAGAIPTKKSKIVRDREAAMKSLFHLYKSGAMPILEYL